MAAADDPSLLADGTYDALVVDAEPASQKGSPADMPTTSGSDDDSAPTVRVELTILAGPHKGQVVAVSIQNLPTSDPLALLGIPASIHVTDGQPHVTFEP